MSGGYWNYVQYRITDPVDDLKNMAVNDDWPKDIRDDMLTCAKLAEEVCLRMHRIDWLLSGDDGVETYRKRLEQDLSRLKDGHSDVQFYPTCPVCPSFVTKAGITRRPQLAIVETNWNGTGADIAECDQCGEVFQINYKIDSLARFQ